MWIHTPFPNEPMTQFNTSVAMVQKEKAQTVPLASFCADSFNLREPCWLSLPGLPGKIEK